jgi:predicted phage terminase large subunit-like protein
MKAEKARVAEEARLAKEKAKAERAARAEAKRQAAAERAAQRAASPRPRRYSTTPPVPTPLPPVAPPPPPPTPVLEAWAMPYEPPDYRFDPSADPLVELAARELCRRRLLPFIQRFRPKYLADWVHEDICRRLERFVAQVEAMQSPRLMINVPVRTGKLLADETWVPTEDGWKRHGDLAPGDKVLHYTGKVIEVLAVGPKAIANVEVVFSDGGRVLCHENHEWPVYDPILGRYMNLSAGFIMAIGGMGDRCHVPPMQARWGQGERVICEVRFVPPGQAKPGHCIQVSSPDGLYVIADETRTKFYPTHNSEISSRHFPAWILGRHPEWELIAASHTASLSLSFSRYLRDLMRDPAYLAVFPEARLDPQSQSVENWNLVKGGGYLAAGRGSGISGRGCIHHNTLIQLAFSGKATPISRIKVGDWVYGFDHATGKVKPVKVLAISASRTDRELWQIGDVILTDDHRVSTSLQGDYLPANEIGDDTPLVQWDGKQLEVSSCRSSSKLCSRPVSQDRPPHIEHWHECHARPGVSVLSSAQVVSSTEGYCARGIADCLWERGGYFVVDIQTETGNYFVGETNLLVHNCHILLLDDLIKDMEEADSAVVRDSTMDWYYSTALTRLAPGGGVVAVLTQWHSDDWSGRIQEAMSTGEGDNFEVVRYPALNDMGDEYILPDDTIVQWPPESPEPPPPGSRLTRLRGTAVHPKRYTTEMIEATRRNLIASGQKRVWDALFQQNPLPDEGIYFDRDNFRYRPPPPLSEMYLYQAWDFAISEKKTSDYTVGVCIGVDMRDDVYVLDMRRFRSQDGIAIVESILDFALHYAAVGKSLTLGFEDGQIWKAISAQFAKRCGERRYYPAYEVLVPLTDKLVRASPLKGRMQLGKVNFDRSAPWFTELDKELRQFPSGKNDDIVDAVSWAVRLTLDRAPPRAPGAPKKPPSWKDKLFGSKSGRSHMAA